MEAIIRNAERKDLPQILELIKELAIYEKEPDAVEVTVAELEDAGFGKNPQYYCFVAEVSGTIVGMALLYFRFSTWKGKTVHLEDLIVTQSMRGKGIGEQLYRRVMEFALAHDVKRVNWEVIGWNTGAIQFYERTGAKVLNDWWRVDFSKDGLEKYMNL